MKQRYLLLIVILIPMFFGCTIKHEYEWYEMEISSEEMPPEVVVKEGKIINIIKGKSNNEEKDFGSVGPHHYFATTQVLTDAVADQLAIELRKKRVKIENGNEKYIEITVTNFQFEQNFMTICTTLDINLIWGNDKNKSIKVNSCTPGTVPRLYDGVVQVAVLQILKEPEVLAYINS